MAILELMSDLEVPLNHTPLGVPSIVTGEFNIDKKTLASRQLSDLMKYFMVFISVCSNKMGVTCGSGISIPSITPEITLNLSGVGAAQSLVFCVVFC